MNSESWLKSIRTAEFKDRIYELYGEKVEENLPRYEKLIRLFDKTYGEDKGLDIAFFSAPGRTEIGGNHTDHERGRVLAASVDLDSIAAAAKTDDGKISVLSEGYPLCTISVDDLSVREDEKNSTASLIRGVAAGFAKMGCKVGGFKAVVTSTVLPGSGLSSSASFEVLIGNIVNSFYYDSQASAVRIAQIGQFAENVYFGKPSGLMDQMACSVGNILSIDFEDPEKPVVRKLDVDFQDTGLKLCIINCWASHADLTGEYAAIPVEMQAIAGKFGKKVLREVPKEDFFNALPELRKEFGDRAVLRAIHFYGDNDRVTLQADALESGNIDEFLKLVSESGRSSWMYLQNIVPLGANENQEMAIALALCEKLLGSEGAFRVHGGGFAGTCQAFVPAEMIDDFTAKMEKLLGKGCCHVQNIRPVGGVCIK